MKKGRRRFGRLGIRIKLMFVFILLLSAISGLFSLANLEFNSRETEDQARYTATQALQQTASFIENKCSAVIDILDIMSVNETIITLITQSAEDYPQTLSVWWEDASRLNGVLFSMRSNKDISRFHLYFSNGMSALSGNSDFSLLSDIIDEPWYRELSNGPYGYLWYPPGSQKKPDSQNMVTAVRKIPSPENLKHFIGLIRADIPVSLFQEVLDLGQFAPSAVLVLTNSRGEVLCASKNYRPENEPFIRNLLTQSRAPSFPQGDCRTLQLDGTAYLAGTSPINRSDWTLSILIPATDVMALGIRTQQRILLIFLVIVPLTVPLAFWAARSSTNRILQLAAQMRTFGKAPTTRKGPRGFYGDEIDELEYDYSEMLSRMESLMDEQYTLGIQNKNLELKALQAQINPHFLYNTLDLINMMGLQQNRPEIAELVKALASFYRLSLGKGEDIVTIGKELDLVRAYLKIQNMRFDNCVTLSINIPADLLDVPIPKIILQPLVENALLHGILESESEAGTITITGFRKDGRVVVCIRDDGCGMDPVKAEKLVKSPATLPENFLDVGDPSLSMHTKPCMVDMQGTKDTQRVQGMKANQASFVETPSNTHACTESNAAVSVHQADAKGYGVYNIDERLKILHGDSYGIRVCSAPGQGTLVYVVIRDSAPSNR